MLGKLQFGVYELDRDILELRKQGVPIRLQEQPLRVLAALMERPGQIVTREELRARIWGDDTFVDFEQSLNKAVNRLREALDDQPGQPRYVETVPRRGYRLIAPVTGLEQPAPPPTAVSIAVPSGHEPRRPRIAAIVLLTASVLVITAVGAVLFWRRPEKHTFPEPKLITAAALCCPRLSPDGKLLAYTSLAGGSMRIWIQPTAGGVAVPVTTGGAESGEDFSPDGTHLAFVGKEGIYVAPTFSGEAKLLAKGRGGFPHFSPSGQRILYWEQETSDVMTVSVDSGERISLKLNRDFHVLPPPMWSPNGEEVLFYGGLRRQPDKSYQWWVAPLTTGEPKPLTLPGIQQNSSLEFAVSAWVRRKDGEWIIYSTDNRDGWKLLRVRISAQGQIYGEPEQIAAGAGKVWYSVSVSQDGTLVYPINRFAHSLYEIPMGDRGQKRGVTLQLPLPEGGSYSSPSVSRDGRWMAYNATVPGKSNLIVRRDFLSGSDLVLDEGRQPDWEGETIISPDGSKLAFERPCKSGQWYGGDPMPCTFMIPAAGGELKELCEFCTPRGFSANGSALLIQKYTGREDFDPPDSISLVDLSSGVERKFLSTPHQAIYHAFFSWDDRWVAFKKETQQAGTAQILIAPVRSGAAGKESEWIAITDDRFADDKPQFSPDGNTVYFTSNRDGYLCIWQQRLNPATKRPAGEPQPYEHFHYNSLQVYSGGYYIGSDLSVARDKMVINLPQTGYDIWMTRIQ